MDPTMTSVLEDDTLRAVYQDIVPLSPPSGSADAGSLSTSPPAMPDPHMLLKESKRRHITLTSDQKHKLRHAAQLQKTAKALDKLQPLIPANFVPDMELSVRFQTGKRALLGKELSVVAALTEPTVKWDAEPDTFYTIVCVDPDFPSRAKPTEAEVRHWVVANIRGCDVDHGEYLQEYEPPAPGIGSGLHHYVVMLFVQEKGFMDLRTFEGHRNRWSAMRWATKNNMRLVAANFWQSQEKH